MEWTLRILFQFYYVTECTIGKKNIAIYSKCHDISNCYILQFTVYATVINIFICKHYQKGIVTQFKDTLICYNCSYFAPVGKCNFYICISLSLWGKVKEKLMI